MIYSISWLLFLVVLIVLALFYSFNQKVKTVIKNMSFPVKVFALLSVGILCWGIPLSIMNQNYTLFILLVSLLLSIPYMFSESYKQIKREEDIKNSPKIAIPVNESDGNTKEE